MRFSRAPVILSRRQTRKTIGVFSFLIWYYRLRSLPPSGVASHEFSTIRNLSLIIMLSNNVIPLRKTLFFSFGFDKVFKHFCLSLTRFFA